MILAALEKRQRFYSRLTTAPTFKPPPRVTLPDTRREAWLRDLANPLVPLRRLSRTIPHGLKGPVLLDQCAAKSIPTSRALWFARCVGANELRGLRRKGVGSFALGSESKWLREWTVQVARFLERAISEFAAPLGLWKQKMLYACVFLGIGLFYGVVLSSLNFAVSGFLNISLPKTCLTARYSWSGISHISRLAL